MWKGRLDRLMNTLPLNKARGAIGVTSDHAVTDNTYYNFWGATVRCKATICNLF